MQLTINETIQNYQGDPAIPALLAWLHVPEERVAVVLNGKVIPRKDLATTCCHENDRIDLLSFAGGG